MDFYFACALALVCGLLIGMGTRLWNMPTPRPAITVGDMVQMRGRQRAGEFRVKAECVGSGPTATRALYVQRVASGLEVGNPAWCFEWELERRIPIEVTA